MAPACPSLERNHLEHTGTLPDLATPNDFQLILFILMNPTVNNSTSVIYNLKASYIKKEILIKHRFIIKKEINTIVTYIGNIGNIVTRAH